MTTAIIGYGNVGKALGKGLSENGYEIMVAGHDAEQVLTACQDAEIIILSVPFTSVRDVVATAGEGWKDKIIIDVTNALNDDMTLAIGYTSSGAEELQKLVPDAKVVKAFNGIFAQHMSTGTLKGQILTTFVAGDDKEAKETVLKMARDIGFDAVDAGPLQNARLLEPFGYLNIQLGYVLGLGADIGFHLQR